MMALATEFRHGVHPPEEKELTCHLPIRRMPYPDELVLPLRQHAGKPAVVCVKVGDRVERGDKVGVAHDGMRLRDAFPASAKMHSGTIPPRLLPFLVR